MRTGVAFACGLALLHAVAARAADDAACTGEPFGDGQVKSVIDGRTLLLADGREVRLAGIEAPGPGRKAALEALVAGRDVALLRLGPDTDRYGRTVALVALQDEPAGTFGADGAAGAQGRPGFRPISATSACAAALIGARNNGPATAGLGLWADPYYVMRNAEDPAGILAVRGHFAVVEGKVLSVRESGGDDLRQFRPPLVGGLHRHGAETQRAQLHGGRPAVKEAGGSAC